MGGLTDSEAQTLLITNVKPYRLLTSSDDYGLIRESVIDNFNSLRLSGWSIPACRLLVEASFRL